MYSSLDRSDLMVQHKDGTNIIIQTDHRTSSEVEAEGEISTVFAIIRVLNAARMGMQHGGPFKVQYSAQEHPPDHLHQAIASAGGILTINNNEVPYPYQPPHLATLLNGSIIRLARTVSHKHDIDITLEGLREVERLYFESRPDHDEDEITYWTSVVELGAFGGEVLRGFQGGGWNSTQHDLGSIPVAFECGPMVVNPLGKAIKFLDNGEEDSLAFMIQVTVAEMDQMGPTGVPPRSGQQMAAKKKGLFGRMFSK